MPSMKAVVLRKPGPPEVLKIEQLPIPKPGPGWVLIKVKAFGLNRSELFTRQGLSPNVKFPRVPGVEAAGIVEEWIGREAEAGERPVWRAASENDPVSTTLVNSDMASSRSILQIPIIAKYA